MSALMLSLIIVSSFVAHKLLVCLYAWYASLLVLLKVLHLHLQFVFVFFYADLPLAACYIATCCLFEFFYAFKFIIIRHCLVANSKFYRIDLQ